MSIDQIKEFPRYHKNKKEPYKEHGSLKAMHEEYLPGRTSQHKKKQEKIIPPSRLLSRMQSHRLKK